MKAQEQQILEELNKSNPSSGDIEEFFLGLIKLNSNQGHFGVSSAEFINNLSLREFISKYCTKFNLDVMRGTYIGLWFRIEDYLINKDKLTLAQEKLDYIEESLKYLLRDMTPETKSRGIAILPKDIANREFIRNIYLSNDEKLTNLFSKYFPVPDINVFEGHPIPEKISKKHKDSTQEIKHVLKRNKDNLSTVENAAKIFQRRIRSEQRKRENVERVSYRYNITSEESKKILEEANTPYMPSCDPALANRIIEAAKKAKLFSDVKHVTRTSAVESIFDNGLYGRRTIVQFYMPFKPAALFKFDIEEGDANVVCLSAGEIDPQAKPEIELQFDADKIAENNPCIFFKQRDLGFSLKKTRNVKIGEIDLFFSHTEKFKSTLGYSEFLLYNNNDFSQEVLAYSKVKNSLLVAYDIEKMHQILTLNFFRYIDGLVDESSKTDKETIEKIYSALAKLSDKELEETLQNIGKNLTDTMEFNIYGAYQIDFSALLSIKNAQPPYNLNLPAFVETLKAGDVKKLNEVKENIPELFKSLRFIDYLLLNTKNESVISILTEDRRKCTLPSWGEPKNF